MKRVEVENKIRRVSEVNVDSDVAQFPYDQQLMDTLVLMLRDEVKPHRMYWYRSLGNGNSAIFKENNRNAYVLANSGSWRHIGYLEEE